MTAREKAILAGVGAGIRRWRKKAGLTIAQLAEQASMDSGFLAYVETGKKMPSIQTAVKIAAALDLQLSDLFKDVPGERIDAAYQLERQIFALLHGASAEHKRAVLGLLRDLRNPKRLASLRNLIRS